MQPFLDSFEPTDVALRDASGKQVSSRRAQSTMFSDSKSTVADAIAGIE